MGEPPSSLARFKVAVYLVMSVRRLIMSLGSERRLVLKPNPRFKCVGHMVIGVNRFKSLGFKSPTSCKSPPRLTIEKPLLTPRFKGAAYLLISVHRLASLRSQRLRSYLDLCSSRASKTLQVIGDMLAIRSERAINEGKCAVLLRIVPILEMYLSGICTILSNNPKDVQYLSECDGLLDFYYHLQEMSRLFKECQTLIQQSSTGDLCSTSVFTALESSENFKYIILEWSANLQLLVCHTQMIQDLGNTADLEAISGNDWVSSSTKKVKDKKEGEVVGISVEYWLRLLELQAHKDLCHALQKLKMGQLRNSTNKQGIVLDESEALTNLLSKRLEMGKVIDNSSKGHLGSAESRLAGFFVDPNYIKSSESLHMSISQNCNKVTCFGETLTMRTFYARDTKNIINLTRFRHPNLVKVIWYSPRARPCINLLTEYFDTTLEILLHNEGFGFSELCAVDILLQVAKGMRYLHGEGMVHGNLISGNIVVWECEKCAAVKVFYEFGLGSATLDSHVKSCWTAEEILNEKEVSSFASDVYNFGSLSSEVLDSCKVTFQGFDEQPRSIHVDLIQLVEACLDADPEKRPSFQKICLRLEETKMKLSHLHLAD